jgi:hypothetical protein
LSRIARGTGIGRTGASVFPEVVLTKDYYRYKGKGYATEVVTTAEKLPPDNLEGVKDNSGEAQS